MTKKKELLNRLAGFKVLCPEPQNFSKKGLEIFDKFTDLHAEELTQNQFEKIAINYHVLLVRLSIAVNKKIIQKSSMLKVIISPTTGIDHINQVEAIKKDIIIICLKGETEFLKSVTSTAEHTLAILLSLIRNVNNAFLDVKENNWRRDIHRGKELKGKNLCIVGLGRLGSIVANYGKAFGMNLFFYDPNVEEFGDQIKKVKTLDELLKLADVLSIHVPLKDETIGLIGEKEISLLNESSFLINTSRAKIVDEKALIDALKKDKLAGAAVDVLENEFDIGLNNHPMIEYAQKNDNLLITPHIGGATQEAIETTDTFIFEKFKIAFQKNSF